MNEYLNELMVNTNHKKGYWVSDKCLCMKKKDGWVDDKNLIRWIDR